MKALDDVWLMVGVAWVWIAVAANSVHSSGTISGMFRRTSFMSGSDDTNASLCLFLRFLFTYLNNAPVLTSERRFGITFMNRYYVVWAWLITKISWMALPPLLRPFFSSYLGRCTILAELMTDCIEVQKMRQVIILGAGYDALAFRLRRKDVVIYEVDLESIQLRKVRGLEQEYRKTELAAGQLPGCKFIRCDFEKDSLWDKLEEGGVNPLIPTVVLLEGVSYYIDAAELERSISDLVRYFEQGASTQKCGSPSTSATSNSADHGGTLMSLILDFMTLDELNGNQDWIWNLNKRQAAAFGAPFKTGFNDMGATLQKLGLTCGEIRDCASAGRLFLNANGGPFRDGVRHSVAGHRSPLLQIVKADLRC